jgi:ParB-like chromosome segregation protein Spo0J
MAKKPTDTPAIHCKHTRLEPIENLREHPKNPNKHSDTQIALLAKNIRHLGWRHPILVSGLTGFIVAGHARLQAARVLNLASVPIDVQPFDSETEELAYLIADNRLAELAEIQMGQIKDLLQELDDGATDMDLTGFDAAELERLMLQFHDPNFEPGTEDDQGRLDELAPKPVCCPKCGERFDAREQL